MRFLQHATDGNVILFCNLSLFLGEKTLIHWLQICHCIHEAILLDLTLCEGRNTDRGGLGGPLFRALSWRGALFNVLIAYLSGERGHQTVSVLGTIGLMCSM